MAQTERGYTAGALTRDGSLVAAATGEELLLRDGATGAVLHTLLAHEPGEVTALAFSPDGTRLASGCAWRHGPPTLVLWDTRTGAPLAALEEDHTGVTALAFTHDGARLAVLHGTDEWAALCLRDGATLRELRREGFGQEHACAGLCATRDGSSVLLTRTRSLWVPPRGARGPDREDPGEDVGCVERWDLERRERLWAARASASSVGLCAEDRVALALLRGDAGLLLLDVASGAPLRELPGEQLFAYGPRGEALAGSLDPASLRPRLRSLDAPSAAPEPARLCFLHTPRDSLLPRGAWCTAGGALVAGEDLALLAPDGALRWRTRSLEEPSSLERLEAAHQRLAADPRATASARLRSLRYLRARSPGALRALRAEGALADPRAVSATAAPHYDARGELTACALTPEALRALPASDARLLFAPRSAWWDPSSARALEALLRAHLEAPDAHGSLPGAWAECFALCLRLAREQGIPWADADAAFDEALARALRAGRSAEALCAAWASAGLGPMRALSERLLSHLRARGASAHATLAASRTLERWLLGAGRADAAELRALAAEALLARCLDAAEAPHTRELLVAALPERYPEGVALYRARAGLATPPIPPWRELPSELTALSRELSPEALCAALDPAQEPAVALSALLLAAALLEWNPKAALGLEPAVRGALRDPREALGPGGQRQRVQQAALGAYRALTASLSQTAPPLEALRDAALAAAEQRLGGSPLDARFGSLFPVECAAVRERLLARLRDRSLEPEERLAVLPVGGVDLALLEALARDRSEPLALRAGAARALGRYAPSAPALCALALDPEEPAPLREDAVRALGAAATGPALEALLRLLEDPSAPLSARYAAEDQLLAGHAERVWAQRERGGIPPRPLPPVERWYENPWLDERGQPMLYEGNATSRRGSVDPEELLAHLESGADLSRVLSALRLAASVARWSPEHAPRLRSCCERWSADPRSYEVPLTGTPGPRRHALSLARFASQALAELPPRAG